ncbi:MAG: hypothetical protein ONB48_01720 [candidate division KSB1 bacterium]|nr:hypothetical protein [candidate division KSB1 bacterium]MDZ7272603.1 hypothetical protein [candidate division KSB1 bacterium]MDZ7284374.1 hypothetical protein [candidate division KSB1 bacterium]MDZ7297230.1 hypothetical protein [candidate division KSB1 bacterium]MDZ7308543.1 hypothetical protein [candidate division KSB1 bacterium]
MPRTLIFSGSARSCTQVGNIDRLEGKVNPAGANSWQSIARKSAVDFTTFYP